MKSLLLVRHAKSSWKDSTLPDFERPLNKRGKSSAPLMGQLLATLGYCPDLIMSSPAKRARKTARLIAGEIGYADAAIEYNPHLYEAAAVDLLYILQRLPDHISSLMLCGHNPALTELAGMLATVQPDNIPTCGLFWLDFPIDSWQAITQHRVSPRLFTFPKALHPED